METKRQLWFDVGIKRYTTNVTFNNIVHKLWFDVGIKRYTTKVLHFYDFRQLWFDVGIKRYTTKQSRHIGSNGCGLM